MSARRWTPTFISSRDGGILPGFFITLLVHHGRSASQQYPATGYPQGSEHAGACSQRIEQEPASKALTRLSPGYRLTGEGPGEGVPPLALTFGMETRADTANSGDERRFQVLLTGLRSIVPPRKTVLILSRAINEATGSLREVIMPRAGWGQRGGIYEFAVFAGRARASPVPTQGDAPRSPSGESGNSLIRYQPHRYVHHGIRRANGGEPPVSPTLRAIPTTVPCPCEAGNSPDLVSGLRQIRVSSN